MFQYVRQAENRWLGKTYILRLNDENDAYAMDISGLTPEQSADLQERYYNQITIRHESVVKSDGILELDASQKSQFPPDVGNILFVELIDNSIKQKTRIGIPRSILQRLQYFKKLISIFRDLFLQEISHGDMFEECIEIYHSESSEDSIDIYISGFGRNSGDIVPLTNMIGNHSFVVKRNLQLAYERDISFLSTYFRNLFDVSPNQEEISFFSEIVDFRESLLVHQFTIPELYDHIHSLLQTCKRLLNTQNQQDDQSEQIDRPSLNIKKPIVESNLTNDLRDNGNEINNDKEVGLQEKSTPRSRKSQIFSAKTSPFEDPFSANYFEKLRSKEREQSHIDRFDGTKKRVIKKRRKNAFASKQAQQFVQKVQTSQKEPIHNSQQKEEIIQEENLQENISTQASFSNNHKNIATSSDNKNTPDVIEESIIYQSENKQESLETSEDPNPIPDSQKVHLDIEATPEDIFSQTIPFEVLQSSPSISFRENTSYIQSQETSELKSLEDQEFEDISKPEGIDPLANSEQPTNTDLFVPVQQSKEEQIVSKKTTPSQKLPSDFPSALSTEKSTSNTTEHHSSQRGSKLDSDFFFSSIMEKIQNNEIQNN